MLKYMRLRNVKGFLDTGDIELRPITLVIGQNSSGKSSILRFPLVLRQTLLDDSMAALLFYGKSIDYGSYDDVVFGHSPDRIIEFSTTIRSENSGRNFYPLAGLRDVLPGVTVHGLTMKVAVSKHTNSVIVHRFSVGLGDGSEEQLVINRQEDGDYLVSWRHPRRKRPTVVSVQTELFDKFLPSWRLINPTGSSKKRVELSDTVTQELWGLFQSLDMFWYYFAQSVSYIGPFRRTPERAYRRKDNAVWHVGSDGEFAPVVLAQDARTQGRLVQEVSDWLQTNLGFELRVHPLGGDMFTITVVDSQTKAENNIIDVGHGLSQLIPIVVQTFMHPRDFRRYTATGYELSVIEQPELHLHPAAQASLADLFITGTRLHEAGKDLSRKFFLIETHSEHLLLRLRRRIVEGTLSPDQVAIYYTSKQCCDGDEPGSVRIQKLEIDQYGNIENWPEGFFAEDYDEVRELRRAIRRKRLEQGEDEVW